MTVSPPEQPLLELLRRELADSGAALEQAAMLVALRVALERSPELQQRFGAAVTTANLEGVLSAVAKREDGLGDAVRGTTLALRSNLVLHRALELLERMHLAPDAHGHPAPAFEGLLDGLQPGALGQARASESIARLLVSLVDIGATDVVLDPAVGTGALLVEAHRAARRSRLLGIDLDASMMRLAALNLALHEVPDAQLWAADSLTAGFPADGGVDVVLSHLPFSGTLPDELAGGPSRERLDFAIADRCVRWLRPGGRAALLVSESFVGGRTKRDRAFRQRLLTLAAAPVVIALPPGALPAQRATPAAIVVLHAADPAPSTLLIELGEPEGIDVLLAHLPRVLAAIAGRADLDLGPGVRMRRLPAGEIAANRFSLEPTDYQQPEPPSQEDDYEAVLERLLGTNEAITAELEQLRRTLT